MTGLEIALSSAQFLDKTAKGDGTFNLSYNCDQSTNPKCVINPKDPSSSSDMITLAYLELFKKTQANKYKVKADQAIEATLKTCQINPKYCDWNFLPLFVWFEDTKDQKYLDAMLNVADKFMIDQPLKNTVANNHGHKLEMLYKATGDKKYLNKLLAQTDELLSGTLNQQIISNNLLTSYRASKKDKYLDAAKDYYKKIYVLDLLRKTSAGNVLFSEMLAIENLSYLASLDPSSNFLQQANEVADFIIKTQWDNPENQQFDADYGWLRDVKGDLNIKATVHTARIIRLFLKMDNQTFSLN